MLMSSASVIKVAINNSKLTAITLSWVRWAIVWFSLANVSFHHWTRLFSHHWKRYCILAYVIQSLTHNC